jgi:hypothetical protein
MATECNRRDFVKGAVAGITAAKLTARSYGRVLGANDRIQIGQIGCGSRGIGVHMAGIQQYGGKENAEITAVCDPWSTVREKANELVKEWYGHEARQFVSYRDLLGFKHLDAVVIASCDHHHATQLEAVAKAGKHVYVEKPIARNMKELVRAVDACQAAGITVQVGTQIRSLPTSERRPALRLKWVITRLCPGLWPSKPPSADACATTTASARSTPDSLRCRPLRALRVYSYS